MNLCVCMWVCVCECGVCVGCGFSVCVYIYAQYNIICSNEEGCVIKINFNQNMYYVNMSCTTEEL